MLANAYWLAGRFEESLEYFDKALRLGPNDRDLYTLYQGKARAYFGLKNYDQAIEWSRRTTAVNRSGDATSQQKLISALALAGRQAEAHEALRDYLGQQYGSKTIAANRAAAVFGSPVSIPIHDFWTILTGFSEGLREAGMAAERSKFEGADAGAMLVACRLADLVRARRALCGVRVCAQFGGACACAARFFWVSANGGPRVRRALRKDMVPAWDYGYVLRYEQHTHPGDMALAAYRHERDAQPVAIMKLVCKGCGLIRTAHAT